MRRYFLILLVTLGWLDMSSQHGAMYSQYMFNTLLLNPAYAGNNEVLSMTALNRNQWLGFDGAPRTTSFSLHSPLKSKKVNLGLSFVNDQLGITRQNTINAVYAYRIFFKNSSLAFGIQAGLDLIRNDWSQISTTTTGDQVFMNQSGRQNIPQAGAGVYYKSEKFFIGASAPDFFVLKQISGTNYKPGLVHAGYLFSVSEDFKLKPSLLFKYVKNSPAQLDLNLNAYYRVLGLGVSLRTSDAFVFLASLQITDQFAAGYSYDLTYSKLHTFVRGTHEIMLRYEFGYKVHPQSTRYF